MEQNGTQPPGSRPVRHRTRKQPPQAVAPATATVAEDPFALPPIDQVERLRQLSDAADPNRRALENDVGWRARRIKQSNPEYTDEYILDVLHEMLQMKTPLDTIARHFGVNIKTIYNWRLLLQDRYKAEALNFDPLPFFGKTMKFYEGAKHKALQLYATSSKPHEKLRALEQARGAENDMHRMLHLTGFYDAVSFKPTMKDVEGEGGTVLGLLSDLSKTVLTEFALVEAEVEDAEIVVHDAHPPSD